MVGRNLAECNQPNPKECRALGLYYFPFQMGKDFTHLVEIFWSQRSVEKYRGSFHLSISLLAHRNFLVVLSPSKTIDSRSKTCWSKDRHKAFKFYWLWILFYSTKTVANRSLQYVCACRRQPYTFTYRYRFRYSEYFPRVWGPSSTVPYCFCYSTYSKSGLPIAIVAVSASSTTVRYIGTFYR